MRKQVDLRGITLNAGSIGVAGTETGELLPRADQRQLPTQTPALELGH